MRDPMFSCTHPAPRHAWCCTLAVGLITISRPSVKIESTQVFIPALSVSHSFSRSFPLDTCPSKGSICRLKGLAILYSAGTFKVFNTVYNNPWQGTKSNTLMIFSLQPADHWVSSKYLKKIHKRHQQEAISLSGGLVSLYRSPNVHGKLFLSPWTWRKGWKTS